MGGAHQPETAQEEDIPAAFPCHSVSLSNQRKASSCPPRPSGHDQASCLPSWKKTQPQMDSSWSVKIPAAGEALTAAKLGQREPKTTRRQKAVGCQRALGDDGP
ncbi:hypothetical protein AOLI_G00066560 [Acnodon oligacanthus]